LNAKLTVIAETMPTVHSIQEVLKANVAFDTSHGLVEAVGIIWAGPINFLN
jgi:hypothetical protein